MGFSNEDKTKSTFTVIVKAFPKFLGGMLLGIMLIFIGVGKNLDWKTILFVSAVSFGSFALAVFLAGKIRPREVPLTKREIEERKANEITENPSNERGRFDEYVRASKGFYQANSIIILAHYGKWPIFLLILWGTFNVYTKGLWPNFYLGCFLTFLWFPLIDKLFSKKMDFLVMFGIKFAITICALFLIKIIEVYG